MVVFTCGNCGDSVQKPGVAKHYQFKCRSAIFLTCVDCLKDFRGEEYVAHTKCISEAERYGGKDYVPKAGAHKGERKQQEWLCVVNNLLNGSTELSSAERNFLNVLSNYENIPRKKAKFLNFIRNAMGNRVNMSVANSVWDKMETMHKRSNIKETQQEQDSEQSEKQSRGETLAQNINSNTSLANQENIIENENNENISKEKKSAGYQNGNNKTCETNGTGTCEKKKKSKKRRLRPIDTESEVNQPAAKIPKALNVEERTKDENSNVPFDWKKIILDIVQARGKISLKKLQNKTAKKYIHYVSTSNNAYELTGEEQDKIVAKFCKTVKKLKKTSSVLVSEGTVELCK